MQVAIAEGKRFETHNLIEKIVRIFSIPVLNNMPGH